MKLQKTYIRTKENGDKELMKIELHELTDENMKQYFDLKVAKDQMQYIRFVLESFVFHDSKLIRNKEKWL